ncbi:hypothetical protein G3N95_29990 [Paraburkholderia sp. Tr-20389]|uniref:hypothetical protein n=1 Tax=Paraburkholderia sp. Tr-20389 TaxID=2703903 RepID=UPI00197FCCAC|nr:hypothetical protein [Paraburkholderia sp. Tr-20389]MBN3757206.1 hypothetical protein [Paraburkholderia sp. Tr-20389]
MNSRQRRKERREEERFAATPEGAALIKAIGDLERFTAETRELLSSAENILFKGVVYPRTL